MVIVVVVVVANLKDASTDFLGAHPLKRVGARAV